MTDYVGSVAIFSKKDFLLSRLVNFLTAKNFLIKDNPSNTSSMDYVVLNISSGLDIDKYENFLKKIDKKCVVILSKKQEGLSKKILDLNSHVSILILSGNKSNIYDYSLKIFKELMSFGHRGKYQISGKEIKKTENINRTKKLSKKNNFKQKYLPVFVLGIVLTFFLSSFMFIISIILLFFSISTISSNQLIFEKAIYLSEKTLEISSSFGYDFIFTSEDKELTTKTLSLVGETVNIINYSSRLVDSFASSKNLDLKEISTEISAGMHKIYNDLGFANAILEKNNSFFATRIKKYLKNKNVEVDDYLKKIYALSQATSDIESFLGKDRQSKYLVLFQNNMELRPTGGFIGSFAILSFDKGKLAEMNVMDVYSADGQLKGHVDPPEPIKEILGEGGWYLRDANWDPDFPRSAEKIEWFLDKEIDQKVDGVFAVDLFFVKKLLDVTGPLSIPDFNEKITKDNLYEIIQNEIEEEFFPGSSKKSNILTALSRQLLFEIQEIQPDRKNSLIKSIYESLEEKHIQLYFHDLNLQKAVGELGYGGMLNLETACGPRCYSDGYYYVDANLGVNKSNQYINRSQDLYIEFNKETVSHKLSISYNNKASEYLGKTAKYKSFSRVVLPKDTLLDSIKINKIDGTEQNILDFRIEEFEDRVEVGFLVEVDPKKSLKILIFWEISPDQVFYGGEYRIKVGKQSGTEPDPLNIYIKPSIYDLVSSYPRFVLTQPDTYVYNTSLRKDFNSKIFLK